jgi:mono/diheme cytochrome c family protein
MGVPLTKNFCRKISCSRGRWFRASARVLAVTGCALFIVALFCSLPQPPTAFVHASSNKTKAGAALFHEKGCEHCHGADGQGGQLGPSLSTVGKRLSKAQIEHQIHDGGKAMPSFGEVLQADEINDLVEFLHAKRKAPKVRAAQTATP